MMRTLMIEKVNDKKYINYFYHYSNRLSQNRMYQLVKIRAKWSVF